MELAVWLNFAVVPMVFAIQVGDEEGDVEAAEGRVAKAQDPQKYVLC